jgi:hypothetical protein
MGTLLAEKLHNKYCHGAFSSVYQHYSGAILVDLKWSDLQDLNLRPLPPQ